MAYHGQYHFKLPTDSNYAKIYHYPIVEVTDASPFEYSYTEDIGKGLYNYYLKLPPPQTKESVMRCMQEDLKRAFGFEATVERRKVSVWKMVANPDAASRLKTSGGEPVQPWAYGSIAAGFSARNISMSDCFVALIYHLADSEEYPFIDGTGISGNVDFTVEADMTDFGSVKRELQKQGLDFVKSEKEMTVLVIGEP